MKQVAGNVALTIAEGDTIEVAPVRAWYRLNNESPKNYAYFKAYLALSTPRSIGRLAKQLRMHRQGLATKSADYKWLDRAAAYDDFNNEQALIRARTQREQSDLEWQARRDVQRNAEWDIAQALLEKVRKMLNVPLFKETIVDYITTVENEEIDPDVLDKVGADDVVIIKKVIINEPLDWSAIDMVRFFDVASKMARLATGMATEHKQLRIDVSKLTDEELERLKNE